MFCYYQAYIDFSCLELNKNLSHSRFCLYYDENKFINNKNTFFNELILIIVCAFSIVFYSENSQVRNVTSHTPTNTRPLTA